MEKKGEEGGGPSVRRVRVWQNVSGSNDGSGSSAMSASRRAIRQGPVIKLAIPHYLFTPLPSQRGVILA